MDAMILSAVAGLIAALAATTILGLAKLTQPWLARRRDIRYIREILVKGRKRVMEDKDTYHKNMDATSSADVSRAAQYNLMVKELGLALDKWTPALSYNQRKEIYEALNWFHTDKLLATVVENRNQGDDRKIQYVDDVPDGKWTTRVMEMQFAKEMFDNLQSIKWLKLGDI